jgi:gliding motility-associated-like protein
VFGLPTDNFSMKIFNRWGEIVFFTEDPNEFWDGKLQNDHRVTGTYIYQIEFLNEEGELFEQHGSFVLLKK